MVSASERNEIIKCKFGIRYYYQKVLNNGYTATFPCFVDYPKLNESISLIVESWKPSNTELKIAIFYADDDALTLIVNNGKYINYSLSECCFLPPSLVARKRCIRKIDIHRAIKKLNSAYSLDMNSIRFAPLGIRLTLIDRKSGENTVLRIKSKINT